MKRKPDGLIDDGLIDDGLIDRGLLAVPVAAGSPRFFEHVLAVARAGLGRETPPPTLVMCLKLVLSGALVPTLLASAATVRSVETVAVARKLYAAGEGASGTSPHR